jgi:hypothetical protein
LQENVQPETWVGRPVAFVLEQRTYENEDGDEVAYNVVKAGTTRKPTEEELAKLREDLAGTGILAETNGKAELEAAPEVVEDSEEDELEEVPF